MLEDVFFNGIAYDNGTVYDVDTVTAYKLLKDGYAEEYIVELRKGSMNAKNTLHTRHSSSRDVSD